MTSYVYQKNPNGKTYVYENTTYWDKNAKVYRHKRVCVGHLDSETNEILPNRKKGDVAKQRTVEQGMTETGCMVMNNGISLLLGQAMKASGLEKTLKQSFPADWEKMAACAYYLASEGNALYRLEQWSETNINPSHSSLSSQRISELLPRITPSLQQGFFGRWIAQHCEDEYYAMDITSVSSYSEFIAFVRDGYNRDGEDLPQINLLMATGEKSSLPIYYRLIPGSIKDVSTLQESLENFDQLGSRRLHIVMDKGFYSAKNIDDLYAKHHRFAVGVPFTTDFAKAAVDENREDMDTYEHYHNIMGDELYATAKLIKWKGHRAYVHTYYDSLKAELDNKKFSHKLLVCHDELVNGKRLKENAHFYAQFFFIKETPKRGIQVHYNDAAIKVHKKKYLGWFVMVTNDIKDPVKALEVYRRKDVVEKDFDDLKNDLDMKRLRIHSAAAMDGRLFLQFLALILTTQLKRVMNEHGWFKNHDLQEVIDEMKSLREVQIEGRRKKYVTTPTKFQREISELFGLGL